MANESGSQVNGVKFVAERLGLGGRYQLSTLYIERTVMCIQRLKRNAVYSLTCSQAFVIYSYKTLPGVTLKLFSLYMCVS